MSRSVDMEDIRQSDIDAACEMGGDKHWGFYKQNTTRLPLEN